MEKSIAKLLEVMNDLQNKLNECIAKGTKVAYREARVLTNDLDKLMKDFRKISPK